MPGRAMRALAGLKSSDLWVPARYRRRVVSDSGWPGAPVGNACASWSVVVTPLGTSSVSFDFYRVEPKTICHCEPVVLRAANQNFNDCQWQSYLNVAHTGVAPSGDSLRSQSVSLPSPERVVLRAANSNQSIASGNCTTMYRCPEGG